MESGFFDNFRPSGLKRGEADPSGEVPPPPDRLLLERPRLNGILEEALHKPLTTMVAGAGYGKTLAVYSFVRKYQAYVFWLDLSEADNESGYFWENIIQTFSPFSEVIATGFKETKFPDTNQSFDRVLSLVDRRNNIPEQKHILVLDNFHCIHNSRVLWFVEKFLNAGFENLFLLLISRTEPPINTIAFLAKGRLSRITEEELRFNRDEIAGYFRLLDVEADKNLIRKVYRDTEGWAFAIYLAGLALGKPGDGYTRSSIRNDIFKYINAELFAGLDEKLAAYLVKLSLINHRPHDLLEELSGPEGGALNHGSGSGSGLIGGLEKINSFVRYDNYHSSWHIHHFLLEYLAGQQHLLNEEEKREVYEKAASWCLRKNLTIDAACYYEKGKDYRSLFELINPLLGVPSLGENESTGKTARFLLELLERIIRRGTCAHIVRLIEWGKAAPQDRSGEVLALLRYLSLPKLLLLSERVAEAEAEFGSSIRAFEQLPTSPLRSRVLTTCYGYLGIIGLLSCIATKQYTFAAFFEKASYYFRQFPFIAGVTGLYGKLSGRPPNFSTLISASNTWLRGYISSHICRVSSPARAGEFEEFARALAAALPWITETTGTYHGLDDLAWSEIAFYQGDAVKAEEHAQTALFKAREKKQYEVENQAFFFLLRCKIYSGDYNGVKEIFSRLSADLHNPEFINRHIFYDILRGWFYAHTSRPEELASWLRSGFEKKIIHNHSLGGFENLVKVKYLIAEKQYPQALAVIRSRKNYPPGEDFLLQRCEMKILEAVCFRRWEKETKARKALENAWELSQSNGLDMPFIEAGKDMQILASEVLENPGPIPHSWLEQIRRSAAAYGKKLSLITERDRKRENPGTAHIPFLNRREIRVLTGLSRGLTREEIAKEGASSVPAVKTIITGLYQKLGAVNRADAVRIAAAKGILKQTDS